MFPKPITGVTMFKKEFIKETAKRNGLTQTETEEMLNVILESITEILTEGKEVNFKGFGKFYLSSQSGRTVITPQGKTLRVKSRLMPKFKASRTLRDSFN